MTKILNLDEFQTPVDKSIVLNGKTHSFKPLEVGEFIDQLKEVEELEAAGGQMKPSQYVEYMAKIVMRGFPTLDEAELKKLSTDKLKALSDFVKDEANSDNAGAETASGE